MNRWDPTSELTRKMRFTISRGRLHPTFAAPIKLRNTPPSLRPTSCSVAFNRGSPATICYMRRSSRTIVWLNADSVKCFVEEICGFFRVSHVVIRLEERGRAEIAPVFSVLRYTAPVDPNCGAAIRIMIENQKHFARWIYVTIEISPAAAKPTCFSVFGVADVIVNVVCVNARFEFQFFRHGKPQIFS